MKWAKTSLDDWYPASLARYREGGRAVAMVARKRRVALTRNMYGRLPIIGFSFNAQGKLKEGLERGREQSKKTAKSLGHEGFYMSVVPYYGAFEGPRYGQVRGRSAICIER
jgi:hypothetical protein